MLPAGHHPEPVAHRHRGWSPLRLHQLHLTRDRGAVGRGDGAAPGGPHRAGLDPASTTCSRTVSSPRRAMRWATTRRRVRLTSYCGGIPAVPNEFRYRLLGRRSECSTPSLAPARYVETARYAKSSGPGRPPGALVGAAAPRSSRSIPTATASASSTSTAFPKAGAPMPSSAALSCPQGWVERHGRACSTPSPPAITSASPLSPTNWLSVFDHRHRPRPCRPHRRPGGRTRRSALVRELSARCDRRRDRHRDGPVRLHHRRRRRRTPPCRGLAAWPASGRRRHR